MVKSLLVLSLIASFVLAVGGPDKEPDTVAAPTPQGDVINPNNPPFQIPSGLIPPDIK